MVVLKANKNGTRDDIHAKGHRNTHFASPMTASLVSGCPATCRARSTRAAFVASFSAASRRNVWARSRTSGSGFMYVCMSV